MVLANIQNLPEEAKQKVEELYTRLKPAVAEAHNILNELESLLGEAQADSPAQPSNPAEGVQNSSDLL